MNECKVKLTELTTVTLIIDRNDHAEIQSDVLIDIGERKKLRRSKRVHKPP